MATNKKEKSKDYNSYGDAIQAEVCVLRHSIGRNCRDCEYVKRCKYEERKKWEKAQKMRLNAIRKGSVRSE